MRAPGVAQLVLERRGLLEEGKVDPLWGQSLDGQTHPTILPGDSHFTESLRSDQLSEFLESAEEEWERSRAHPE